MLLLTQALMMLWEALLKTYHHRIIAYLTNSMGILGSDG